MSTIQGIASPLIPGDRALSIAQADALRAYGDLSPYRIELVLEHDAWKVDYELKDARQKGGGPHYVIDAATGRSGRSATSSNSRLLLRKKNVLSRSERRLFAQPILEERHFQLERRRRGDVSLPRGQGGAVLVAEHAVDLDQMVERHPVSRRVLHAA
jgi:hypothetical protein